MPCMPFLQQIQSVPSQVTWMSTSPQLPYIAAGAVVLAEVVALIAGQVFALAATIAVLIAMAFHIQDRTVTKIIGCAITGMIISISLAALFPAYSPIALGCALAIGAGCLAYTYYKAMTAPAKL